VVEEFIDQRDIQRRGYLYVYYPSSAVVADILRKYGVRDVLDVTYGRGRFYVMYRPRTLVGVDPMKWDWIVKPDTFHQTTVYHFYRLLKGNEVIIDKPIDCVVIDPPHWSKNATYRKRDEYNYIIGTPKDIIEHGRKVAELVKAPYILLHFNQQLPIGEPIHIVKFRWFARYAHTENKNLSYYILYRNIS